MSESVRGSRRVRRDPAVPRSWLGQIIVCLQMDRSLSAGREVVAMGWVAQTMQDCGVVCVFFPPLKSAHCSLSMRTKSFATTIANDNGQTQTKQTFHKTEGKLPRPTRELSCEPPYWLRAPVSDDGRQTQTQTHCSVCNEWSANRGSCLGAEERPEGPLPQHWGVQRRPASLAGQCFVSSR